MNDEHPDQIDVIANAMADPRLGEFMRIPDFSDELTRRGGLIVYCDSCDVEKWCIDEPTVHRALLEHRIATRYDRDDDYDESDEDAYFEPIENLDPATVVEFNEDCDDALYVISIVGDAVVPLHHSQF